MAEKYDWYIVENSQGKFVAMQGESAVEVGLKIRGFSSEHISTPTWEDFLNARPALGNFTKDQAENIAKFINENS